MKISKIQLVGSSIILLVIIGISLCVRLACIDAHGFFGLVDILRSIAVIVCCSAVLAGNIVYYVLLKSQE